MRWKLLRDSFNGFYPEALPLLEKHKAEIDGFPDIPLDIDAAAYQTLELAGCLRIYTARHDRGIGEPLKIIGYAAFIVGPHMHSRRSRQALADAFYVDPDYRTCRIGLTLLRFTDQELAKEGVQVIWHHVKVARPGLDRLLVHAGYEETERAYTKRLNS